MEIGGGIVTLKLFTFCVNIDRTPLRILNQQLQTLLLGLDKFTPDYELIVYSNYLKEYTHPKVQLREYYDLTNEPYYSEGESAKWLNLSWNKINIYKDLYDEFGNDYAWVDLDTIFCADVSYLNNLDNYFIVTGGSIEKPHIIFNNDDTYTVPYKHYIQGNFWKLNKQLYVKMMDIFNLLKQRGLQLQFDGQSLFNYCYHYLNYDLNLLGGNVYEDNIYGLGVWSNKNIEDEGLEEINVFVESSKIYDVIFEDGYLYFNNLPNNPIHIWSFTTHSYSTICNTKAFYKLMMWGE
tara:strand:+ start:806 stop:1684 length:879 start_codon:yes stop_codon:yes gene_type:complete